MRYLPNSAWGPASLCRLVTWSPISSVSFSCSSRMQLSQNHRSRGLLGQNPGPTGPKWPGSSSSPWEGWLPWHPGFSVLVSRSFCTSWKRVRSLHWSCIIQETLGASSWPIHGKRGPHPPELHRRGQNRTPGRNRWWRPTDAGWQGGWRQSLPRWNNSDESGSSWLVGIKELSSKSGVGWSQWSRTVVWLILKVAKRVWRVVRGCTKGHPWVHSVQTLLKQETDPRDLGAKLLKAQSPYVS